MIDKFNRVTSFVGKDISISGCQVVPEDMGAIR